MFKIEKNVPMPAPQRKKGSGSQIAETAEAMKVGDSVLFPKGEEKTAKTLAVYLNKLGRKIAIRKERDGTRVWRLWGKPEKRGA